VGVKAPRWGWLYAIFGVMLGLFYVENKLALTSGQRTFALLLVVAIVYLLVDLWIGSNIPFDHWS
jgi:hypothetical protein